jgi:hypothetical protein
MYLVARTKQISCVTIAPVASQAYFQQTGDSTRISATDLSSLPIYTIYSDVIQLHVYMDIAPVYIGGPSLDSHAHVKTLVDHTAYPHIHHPRIFTICNSTRTYHAYCVLL